MGSCCYKKLCVCGTGAASGLWLDATSISALGSGGLKQGGVCYYFSGADPWSFLCHGTLHAGYTTTTGCADAACSPSPPPCTTPCVNCSTCGTRHVTVSGATGSCATVNGSGVLTYTSTNCTPNMAFVSGGGVQFSCSLHSLQIFNGPSMIGSVSFTPDSCGCIPPGTYLITDSCGDTVTVVVSSP